MPRKLLSVDVDAFYEAMFQAGLHAQQMGPLIVAVGVFQEPQGDFGSTPVLPESPMPDASIQYSDSRC